MRARASPRRRADKSEQTARRYNRALLRLMFCARARLHSATVIFAYLALAGAGFGAGARRARARCAADRDRGRIVALRRRNRARRRRCAGAGAARRDARRFHRIRSQPQPLARRRRRLFARRGLARARRFYRIPRPRRRDAKLRYPPKRRQFARARRARDNRGRQCVARLRRRRDDLSGPSTRTGKSPPTRLSPIGATIKLALTAPVFICRGCRFFICLYAQFVVDSRRKRSGVLSPIIGSRDGDFDFALPIYWFLAEDTDATITPRWISERGLLLGKRVALAAPASERRIADRRLCRRRSTARRGARAVGFRSRTAARRVDGARPRDRRFGRRILRRHLARRRRFDAPQSAASSRTRIPPRRRMAFRRRSRALSHHWRSRS